MREVGQRGDLHVLGVAGDRAHLEAGPSEHRGIVGERGAGGLGLGVRLPERGRPERLRRLPEHELLPRLHALDDLAAHAEHRVGDGQDGDRAVGARPHASTTRAKSSGGANGRAASWTATMSTDSGTAASAVRTEACRVSPPSTSRTSISRSSTQARARVPPIPAGRSRRVRRRGERPRRQRRRPRGSGGPRSGAAPSAPPPPSRRPAPAPSRITIAASGSTVRSIADGDAQASAPAVAGASPGSAAKIMRPVVVWITFVTRTSTCEPIRSRPARRPPSCRHRGRRRLGRARDLP